MDTAVIQTWRNVLVSAHDWQPDRVLVNNPGICGGGWMKCVQTGRVAWLKPANGGPGRICAAKEKIAADLAHEICICRVPPVLLYKKDNDEGSLSLVCHSVQHELQDLFKHREATGGLNPALLSIIRQAFDSSIVALDAWVGNKDRANPRNTLLGISRATIEFLYIDFSHAMTWSTPDGGSDTILFLL